MATITRAATANKTGRPGQFHYSEYRRAREHRALVRRDRLGRVLPRSLAKSVPVALLVSLVLAFGVDLPGGFAFGIFVLIVAGWSAVIVLSAFGGDSEIETLRLSAEAERKTARALARLRRHGWVVMHDMRVPSADAVVGHLLVGPAGVLILGSEAGKGVVRYTKKIASIDGDPLTGAIERAAFLAEQIKTELRAEVPLVKIPVNAVLVMVEADVLWKDGAVNGVTIINIRSIVDWARGRPRRLNPAEVKQVVAAARTLFPAFIDNRSIEQVTLHRDQWLMLMDTLHTIRERDGDASDLLDRLASLEAQLSRQADGFTRTGIPTGGDEIDGDLSLLDDDSGAYDIGIHTADDTAPPPPRATEPPDGIVSPLRGARRAGAPRPPGGRRSLATVRPEQEPPAPQKGSDSTKG
ncbi:MULTISPECIES: nuclease-related domain-containing protein [unclassified Pseudofrankia]|uniref:nuclease-related domain-containing protein n=1 Tax=unclassified Pseudofrankia TaxID=2994372 RepID=UPI0008DABCA7|nr:MULTISPECIES: nuclease-related domain-containing protein [unclassified Pseudofrankia]MDT3446531.1 nuclease-related domain-containing protein [Pseudofrankia sp. BMG5.37]OHV43955.1 nuclease [Pseudofrankia sp. BMG5.36]